MIKKLRITSVLYTCLRGAYQVAKAAETSQEEQRRRGIDGRPKHGKSTQRYRYQTEDQSRTEAIHEMGVCLSDLISTRK